MSLSGNSVDIPKGKVRWPAHLGTSLAELVREVGLFAIAGLAGAIVLLVIFAKVSEEVFSNEVTSLDNGFANWIHGFANPALDAIFNAFTFIGGTISITVLAVVAFALLLWRGHHHSAWRLALAVIGGLLINQALKMLFHRTRPDLWNTGAPKVAGFSFPSGHATLSLCLFGMFAWLGWQYIKEPAVRWLWTILMIFIIVMVGLAAASTWEHIYPSEYSGWLHLGGFLASGTAQWDRYLQQTARRRNN